jgi:hypothetical protein
MSSKVLALLAIIVIFIKLLFVIFFASYGHDFFGGGGDSDFYNAFALGETDTVTSVWPVFLRYLNQYGLYSRQGISVVMMILGVVAIPFFASRISIIEDSFKKEKVFFGMVIALSLYPTLFFYSLDIYRDILMLFIFLFGIYFIRLSIESNGIFRKSIIFVFIMLLSFLLYELRPYLGFGFLFSFFCYKFLRFSRFSRMDVVLYGCAYLIVLNFLFYIGIFNSLLSYRSGFDLIEGGANIGIDFSNGVTFIPSFLMNIAFQLFGFYFVSYMTVFVFLLESIPFLFCFFYFSSNRRFSNAFSDYLMIFFIIYSTIWLLGNDNVGTAVRLRMYSYISILISCGIVFQRKNKALTSSKFPAA